MEKEFGVRWTEFNKRNEAVTKQRFFRTRETRDEFAAKLETKDNFWHFDAWLDDLLGD
jgi:hypothetical protein